MAPPRAGAAQHRPQPPSGAKLAEPAATRAAPQAPPGAPERRAAAEPASDAVPDIVVDRERLLAHLRRRRRATGQLLALALAAAGCALLASMLVLRARAGALWEFTEAVESGLGLARVTPGASPGAVWRWLLAVQGRTVAPGAAVVGAARVATLEVGERGGLVQRCPQTAWISLGSLVLEGGVAKPTGCSSAASGRFWIPWAPADAGAPQPSANGLSVGLLLGSERAQLYALASAASAVDLSGASRARASIEVFDAAPVWLDPAADWAEGRGAVLVVDVAFYTVVWALAVRRIAGIAAWCARLGRDGCRSRPEGNAYHLLDWLSIVVSSAVALLYLHGVVLVAGLNDLVGELSQVSVGSNATWDEYSQLLDVVLELSIGVVESQSQLRWCTAVLVVGSVLRLFEASQVNRRLGSMVKALWLASLDLVHLALLLVPLAAAFALSGYLTFGDRVDAFSSLGGAVGSSLLLAVGRAFDPVAASLWEAGGALGVVWVVLFHLSFAFVVLHLVLGVVLARYLDATAEAGAAPTLLREAAGALGRCRGSPAELSAAPPSTSEADARAALRDAARDFGEAAVLRRLEAGRAHPARAVTPASLAAALGAKTWAARALLDGLLARAAAESPAAQAAESMAEGLRVCASSGEGAADVARDLVAVATRLQALDGARAEAGLLEAEDAPGSGSVSPAHTDDFELEDISPPPSPPSEPVEEEIIGVPSALLDESWGDPERLRELCARVQRRVAVHGRDLARSSEAEDARLSNLEASVGRLIADLRPVLDAVPSPKLRAGGVGPELRPDSGATAVAREPLH